MVVRALESIYTQVSDCADVQIIVSDNSTEDLQVKSLAEYVQEKNYSHVRLIRPAQPLIMTQHWEWALSYALKNTQGTHFAFLTDRMLLRPKQLILLEHLCEVNPEQLISYTYDRINDISLPVIYSALPRSGCLYRIESAELLRRSSRMQFSSCLPRMLNSIAPRSHLEKIANRFGSVFASMSPDFCFCFRSLAVTQNILYFDKSILLNYAQSRSNGGSVSRGVKSKDYNDYLASSTERECHLCPSPDIITTGNGVTHEYCYVSAEVAAGKLPDIDIQSYHNYLANEVCEFLDPAQRKASINALQVHGWKKPFLYGLRRRFHSFLKRSSMVISPHFSSLEQCLAYAGSSPPIELSWLHIFIRRYGRQVIKH